MEETGSRTSSGLYTWRDTAGEVEVRFVGRGPGDDAAPGLGSMLAATLPAGVEGAWLKQIHSAEVRDARAGHCGEGDALVSHGRGLALVVMTADCVPVLLASDEAVAAVHAGWRGLVSGVVPAAVEGLRGAPVRAWIGPAIGPCCYEVGSEVARQVCTASKPSVEVPGPRGRPHLDLQRAAAHQLAAAGVGEIQRIDCCTRCHPEKLWSYRRDANSTGRNMALIWRRS